MLTYRRMTDNIRWMPDHLPVRIAHMSTLCSSELQSDPGHTIFIIGIWPLFAKLNDDSKKKIKPTPSKKKYIYNDNNNNDKK